jgi:hypothetical protein
MNREHVCWWTRRSESELADDGIRVFGTGIAPPVLSRAADAFGTALTSRPSGTDEYGQHVTLGTLASGATHDDCFVELHPASPALKHALLVATLDLHGAYLGIAVDWSQVLPTLLARFTPGMTLRLRSDAPRRCLRVRSYPRESSLLRRALARPLVVECDGGVARLTNGTRRNAHVS